MKEVPIDLSHFTFYNIMLFLLAVAVTLTLGNILNLLISNMLQHKVRKDIYKTLAKTTMYSIYGLGFYLSLTYIINFNLPVVLAALGIFGTFFFLPTIPVLQNVIAGIILVFTRPFSEGELLEIDKEVCEVVDKILLKTKLRAEDGKIIFVPNILFITGSVKNYSRSDFILVDLSFDFSPEVDINKLEQIVEDVCATSSFILPKLPNRKDSVLSNILKKKPVLSKFKNKVLVNSLSKDKINISISFWIWDIRKKKEIISDFLKELNRRLVKESISLA